jgi:hypothetical protein
VAATILSLLLAFFKAVPALKSIWDDIVAAYVAQKIATMAQENRDAIAKAISTLDQRPIESELGSITAGKPSGDPGTEIRDTLPGVPK